MGFLSETGTEKTRDCPVPSLAYPWSNDLMFYRNKKSENPGLSLGLESQAVPRILAGSKSSYGTQIPGPVGPWQKILGTGSLVPIRAHP